MQPTGRHRRGEKASSPEQHQAAVIERFLRADRSVAEIAREFALSESAVRALIDRAADAALETPKRRRKGGSLAPPPGWEPAFEPEMPDADADADVDVDADPVQLDVPAAETPAHEEVADDAVPDGDPDPSAELLELAARSVADGSSVASVARWFNVDEAELLQWLGPRADDPPAEPASPEIGSIAVDEPAEKPDPPLPVAPAASQPVRERPVSRPRPAARPPRAALVVAPSMAPPAPTVYFPNGAVGTRRPQGQPSNMGFRDSLQVLRRRFLIVVVALVLGVAAGWMTAPGEAHKATTFRATHTLIYEPQGGQSYNIEQVALLATSGDVPSRVAARLKIDRSRVRSAVSAEANAAVGTISITARSPEAAGAVSLADATADELVASIAGRDQATYQTELDRLTGQVDAAQKHLGAVPPKNAEELAAARGEVASAEQALKQYQAAPPPKAPLRTLEAASPSAVGAVGVKAPNSKPGRALLLGILGLMAGIGVALGLERLDSRIRSKARAEEAFGVPVVAEVPPLAKSLQGQLLTRTQPSSPFVEAYRGLRTYVALWAPEGGEDDGHRVIVVTSPGAGEGKTTSVAHLASLLAEIGRSVVVISADLRRPRLHQFFDVAESPGLVDALAAPDGPDFGGLDHPTSVRGVRLVPSGPPVDNPAALFEHAADLVDTVRGLADFVLIDSPPLLVANDAAELARHADGVLLVSRAGATTVEAARHSAELLDRLAIPVVGTVLVGSEAASSAARYYSTRYYAEPERTGRPRRRSGSNGQHAPTSTSAAPEEAPPATGP